MSQIIKIINRLKRNWSLSQRALCLALIASLCASLLVGLPITRASISQLENQAELLRTTLSKQASSQAADAIFSQDSLSLNVILSNLTDHPDIAYAAVYSLNNDIIAEHGNSENLQSKPLSIRYQNEVIGLLDVQLDNSELNQASLRLYGLWATLSILLTLFNLALGWVGGRWISRRLLTTTNEIRLLEQDKLIKVTQHKVGELSDLSAALLSYHKQQQAKTAMNQALNQFMTPGSVQTQHSLARKVTPLTEESTEQSYRHCAILFLDFVDLASSQATMAPEELAQLLNQYYFFIHQAAKLYNGSVDKFVGDGVMVLFGIPQADEKDAFHGVCTGLLIIGLLQKFNALRTEQHLPIIEFQLGLHSGMVLAGPLGDSENLNYTAVGDAIYTAQRICHASSSNRLLISKDVVNEKALGSQLKLCSHSSITAQNNDPLDTYWANELSANCQALIERQVNHISVQPLSSEPQ